MPVIGMDDIRFKIDTGQHGQYGPGKIRKPFRIIAIAI